MRSPWAGREPTPYRAWSIIDLADYQRLFDSVTTQAVIGEASQDYLSCWQPERTAAKIKKLIPHVRLIAVLRQPAERAYSSFAHQVQLGNEREHNFRQMLLAADHPDRRNWLSYRCKHDGFYYANLKPYYEHFAHEQIRVYLYEDWNTKAQAMLSDIFQFLGVTPQITPTMTQRQNETTWVHHQIVTDLLQKPHWLKRWVTLLVNKPLRRRLVAAVQAWNRRKPPPLDPQLRSELTALYRNDILQLQDLIGRDLSHWLV
ncbi:MAG: sulfotransferase domain-containing protein [Caldilineaceae bacterium]